MARRTTTRSVVAGLVVALSVAAQPADSRLKTLRELGLPEAPGSMPVIYVASAKDRALRLQKSLEAADSWYEKQLNVRVPIVLAVLDPETQEKISDRVLLPHSLWWGMPGAAQGLAVIPAKGSPPAKHPEFLAHEPAGFHEVGHIIAYRLNIRSGNSFVNELVAQMFSVAYMTAERPDLKWVLDNLRSGRRSGPSAVQTPPRYTSLADLDYLYMGVGDANYVWFQQAVLGRLADFLVTDQSFPAVIEKLQKTFPAAEAKQETLEEISRHLEGVRPGFLKAAGPLAGPTTIPRISSSACPELARGAGASYLASRNDTGDSLILTNLDGRNSSIPAHSWKTFNVRAGAWLKLRDGTCLVARDEPSLAVIDRQ
jgi:hypothetical protein